MAVQADLQRQLLLKHGEVETLQEQNMQLRAQVTALQQQLASTSVPMNLSQVQGLHEQVAPQQPA